MLSGDLKRVALRLLKALNVDEANVVADHISNNRWDHVVMTKFDPLLHHDKSVDEFRRICLAQEFLRKAEFLKVDGIDKAQVARDGFLACEAQCFRANRHLEKFLKDPVLETALERSFYEISIRARAWVKRTLGSVPSSLDGRFGPGAVFESEVWRHRKTMTAYDKLRNSPCVSHNMDPMLVDHVTWQTAFGSAWADACPNRLFPSVRGNRFTTVIKDATKDRGIAIEPGVNVVAQLAVGDCLKLRLRRQGIDLRGDENRTHPVLRRLGLSMGRPWKGQEWHRTLARLASVSGSHATIDLSNASDTICHALVKLLLPDEWYILLSNLRSPFTRFSSDGTRKQRRWYWLEKFSSMGNGFTFELETLIFCALAHAVGARIGVDTYVYGDDIIVPEPLAADLLAVLQYVGMTPNEKKTFTGASNFRESCGGDYFFGHDVRPFYIEKEPHDPASWINLANNLRYWSNKWSMPELMAVRASVLDNIPTEIRRCRGPEELGDLVIHDDECRWSVTIRGSIRYVRVWRPVTVKRFLHSRPERARGRNVVMEDRCFGFPISRSHSTLIPRTVIREFTESGVALAAALLGLPSDGIAPRGSVEGYRFGTVAFS